MANKLYVGNLAYKLTNDELKDLFAPYGEVLSAQIICDRDTKRSKGFGFVEMDSEQSAAKAIEELDSKDIHGRKIFVSQARPKSPAS